MGFIGRFYHVYIITFPTCKQQGFACTNFVLKCKNSHHLLMLQYDWVLSTRAGTGLFIFISPASNILIRIEALHLYVIPKYNNL